MTVISTGSIAKLLWPGLNAVWGMNYDEHQTEYTDLVEVYSSDMNYEEDQGMTGFGLAPIKPQGTPTVYDSMQQSYTSRYTHIAYSLGFIITHEALTDNLYEKIGMGRTSSLAFSARQTKENVVANMYNRAFNGSYVGGDGVSMISASHPTTSGNQSNVLGTPADLSEASLEDLLIQIAGAQNDRGLLIGLTGQSLNIPRQLFFEATRIMKSVLQNDTGNNAINALRSTGMLPKGIKQNHYFTDPDAWFVRTDAPQALKLFQREKATFSQDGDFDTDNLKYKFYERYSTGWSDWRGVYGTPGA
jgi:hypothetical protein